MRIIDSEFRTRIGAVIRSNRLTNNMSQKELAERADLTRVFVNQIENGKRVPSEGSLTRIAACFGKELVDLFEEAKFGEIDDRFALALSLKKLVDTQDLDNIRKLLEYSKSLSQDN